MPTSFSLLQGHFLLPYLASSLLSSPTSFLYVFYLSSLFYISLFSYSPMSSPPPPWTHTHCKPLSSSCAEPALPKLPSSCPAWCCTALCWEQWDLGKNINVTDGYWWDLLSDLCSCACREKETMCKSSLFQMQQLFESRLVGWEGTVCATWNYVLPQKKKKQKPTQTIFFVTAQYSTLFYKLLRILLPGITKRCGVHLSFAVLGIIYTVHENRYFSPKIKLRHPYK